MNQEYKCFQYVDGSNKTLNMFLKECDWFVTYEMFLLFISTFNIFGDRRFSDADIKEMVSSVAVADKQMIGAFVIKERSSPSLLYADLNDSVFPFFIPCERQNSLKW